MPRIREETPISAEPTPLRNRLLAALPPEDLDDLRPQLALVPLRSRQILYQPNRSFEHVHFVEDGLISVVADADAKHLVEAWLIGREGFDGLPVVFETDCSPYQRIVQVAGSAWRIGARELRQAIETCPALRHLLLRYAQAVLVQASQSAACNAHHSLQQRLARWLLIAEDRLGNRELALTHEVLSWMLGVRRAGVTDALGLLEREGLLTTARGRIVIEDRPRLERMSCRCYGVVNAAWNRLIAGPPPEAEAQSAALPRIPRPSRTLSDGPRSAPPAAGRRMAGARGPGLRPG